MKNKFLLLTSVITSFLLGVLVTHLFLFKHHMDEVFTPNVLSEKIEVMDNTINTVNHDISTQKPVESYSAPCINELLATNTDANINDYSIDTAKQIVNTMPDYVLEQYVDRFMALDSEQLINNKRRFAERAIEEVYNKNDSSQLTGTANVSFSYVKPKISDDMSTVAKNAKLYAHLNIDSQQLSNQYIFIKWINIQTGQILLFDKKEIFKGSDDNWVSYIPNDGWGAGDYEIRFYLFESELTPIAQTSYSIYEVIDND